MYLRQPTASTLSAPSRPRWTIDRALLIGLSGLLALYVSWQLVGRGDAAGRALVGDVTAILCSCGAIIAAGRVTIDPALDPRTRRSWTLLALAMFAQLLGGALRLRADWYLLQPAMLLSATSAAGDLALLFATAAIMLRPPRAVSQRALHLLIASLIVCLSADVLRGSLGVAVVGGSVWIDGLRLVGWYLLALSASIHAYDAGDARARTLCRSVVAQRLSLLRSIGRGGVRRLATVRVHPRATRLPGEAPQPALTGPAPAAACDAQRAFLAYISHELRTPLATIIGYSELLQMQVERQMYDGLSSDIGKITASGHQLLATINNLLDLSKLETGRMKLAPERIDLSAVLREVAAAVEPLMTRHHNTLAVECATSIEATYLDAIKLRQILLNVLSNAAAFTARGAVTLRVWSECEPHGRVPAAPDRAWLVFEVSDSGIGMTPEQLGRLFEPFVPDRSGPPRPGGAGLGLTISRRLCELMGGALTARSAPGQGSIFTLRLPISCAERSV
jgi:signal transduction histidine kinase